MLIGVCLLAFANGVHDSDAGDTGPDRCGANALAICCRCIDVHVTRQELDRAAGQKGELTSLLDLKTAATSHGLETLGLRWDDRLPGAGLAHAPAVARVYLGNGRPHFVAIVAARNDDLLVVDFPQRPGWIAADELRRRWHWDGALLHVAGDAAAFGALSIERYPERRVWGAALSVLLMCFVAIWLATARRPSHIAHYGSGTTRASRGGFSLIEVLVALGIVSLLAALLLPAIQSARGASRKIACGSQLHQIGVALEAFESSHRRYPAASVSASNPGGTHISNNIAPHVELLPFLDQTALYQQFDRGEDGGGVGNDPPSSTLNGKLLGQQIPVFECPEDPASQPKCNYRVSSGTSPSLHETLPRGPGAALAGYRSLLGRRDGEFVDGKSNTAAFSEKLCGDRDPDTFSAWRDSLSLKVVPAPFLKPDDALTGCSFPAEPQPVHFSFGGYTWALSGYSTTWYNHVLTPNSPIPDCVHGGNASGPGAYTARSLHRGGVNVLFADGGGRFVGDAVDLGVWRAIGSVAGGEPAAVDF